jgi:hypothetical protein
MQDALDGLPSIPLPDRATNLVCNRAGKTVNEDGGHGPAAAPAPVVAPSAPTQQTQPRAATAPTPVTAPTLPPSTAPTTQPPPATSQPGNNKP